MSNRYSSMWIEISSIYAMARFNPGPWTLCNSIMTPWTLPHLLLASQLCITYYWPLSAATTDFITLSWPIFSATMPHPVFVMAYCPPLHFLFLRQEGPTYDLEHRPITFKALFYIPFLPFFSLFYLFHTHWQQHKLTSMNRPTADEAQNKLITLTFKHLVRQKIKRTQSTQHLVTKKVFRYTLILHHCTFPCLGMQLSSLSYISPQKFSGLEYIFAW